MDGPDFLLAFDVVRLPMLFLLALMRDGDFAPFFFPRVLLVRRVAIVWMERSNKEVHTVSALHDGKGWRL